MLLITVNLNFAAIQCRVLAKPLHSHKKCYDEGDPPDPLSFRRFLLPLEAGLPGGSQVNLPYPAELI